MQRQGRKHPDPQRKLYSTMKVLSLQDQEELNKAAHISGENVIPRLLAIISKKVREYKDNRE
jgi:hypothetical protein